MKSCRLGAFFRHSLYAFMMVAPAAMANCDGDCVSTDSWAIGLALGTGEYTNPLTQGRDRQVSVLPSFYYYGEQFYVENTSFGYTFSETQHWSFDVTLAVNKDGLYYHDASIDSVLYAFMPPISRFTPDPPPVTKEDFEQPFDLERDLSVMAGVRASYFVSDKLSLDAKLTTDVSGVHHGQQFDLGLQYSENWQDFYVVAALGINYKSQDLSDYYYGIRNDDFPDINIEYVADRGFNRYAALSMMYPLSAHFSLVGKIQYEVLSSEISDSPLLDEDNTFFHFIGISARFGSD